MRTASTLGLLATFACAACFNPSEVTGSTRSGDSGSGGSVESTAGGSVENSGSGSASTSGDPSGSPAPSSDASSDTSASSPTDETTDPDDTGPLDGTTSDPAQCPPDLRDGECIQCVKLACCEEFTACLADDPCRCTAACIDAGGIGIDCASMCEADIDQEPTASMASCGLSSCNQVCQFL